MEVRKNDRFISEHSVGIVINMGITSHTDRRAAVINEHKPIKEYVFVHHVPELLRQVFVVKRLQTCGRLDGENVMQQERRTETCMGRLVS